MQSLTTDHDFCRTRKTRLALGVVALAAFILACWACTWGLAPAFGGDLPLIGDKLCTFHTDEIIPRLYAMLAAQTLQPPNFIYGTFHTYCLMLLAQPLKWFYPPLSADPAASAGFLTALWLLGRLLSALLAAGTVALVFASALLITRNLAASVVAALSLALAPLFVDLAHYATVDLAMLFWSTLALYLMLRYLAKPTRRLLYWAAFCAGLAASVKLSAGILMPFLWWAAWHAARATRKKENTAWKPLFTTSLLLCGLFALAYLLGTPYALLEPVRWFTDQFRNALQAKAGWGGIHWDSRYPRGLGLLYVFGPALLLSLLGAIRSCRKPRHLQGLLLVALALANWLLFARTHTFVPRYRLPLFPELAILAALGWLQVKHLFGKRPRLAWSLVVVLLLGNAFMSGVIEYALAHDPRVPAAAYLAEHVTTGQVVEATRYGPPLFAKAEVLLPPYAWRRVPDPEWLSRLQDFYHSLKGLSYQQSAALRRLKRQQAQARLQAYLDWCTPQGLAQRKPDWVVLSSLMYERYFIDPQAYSSLTAYYRALLEDRTDYRMVADFHLAPWITWLVERSGEFLAPRVVILAPRVLSHTASGTDKSR